APKPPAMTILLDIFLRLDRLSLEKSFETTKSPLQNLVFGWTAAGDGRVDVHQVLFGQVTHQDLGDTQGDVQLGRDLGQRPGLPAQLVDIDRLRHEGARRFLSWLGCRDQGLHHQRMPWPRPSTGEGERANTVTPSPTEAHSRGHLSPRTA